MGLPPTGEIVARVMLARVCGCLQEFQHYKVDKYRAQRQAKFQKTRCPACVAKLVEQQRIASTLPKKGEAFKQLPLGTKVTLTRCPDGTWTGTLAAAGTAVEDAGGPDTISTPTGTSRLRQSLRYNRVEDFDHGPPNLPLNPLTFREAIFYFIDTAVAKGAIIANVNNNGFFFALFRSLLGSPGIAFFGTTRKRISTS